MHRFFCPEADLEKSTVSITAPQEIHHIKDVLRLKVNDSIGIFNQNGDEILGTVLSISPRKVEVRKDHAFPKEEKRGPTIILGCAIPKRSKFESIVEKTTELGVDEIVPLKTERTEVLWDLKRFQEKKSRLLKVAINASKQSGLRSIPLIHPVTDFPLAIRQFDQKALKAIPCLLGARQSLRELFDQSGRIVKNSPRAQKIIFLIGPEGDFTPEEVRLAVQAGFVPVSLGETVLKVETAAISVVAFARLIFSS